MSEYTTVAKVGSIAEGRGQALYSSLGFGAGSAVGSLMSGYLWANASPDGRRSSKVSVSCFMV